MPFKFNTIEDSLQTAKRKKNVKIPTFSLDQVGTVTVKTVFEVDGDQVSTSTLLNIPRVLVALLDELSNRGISESNEPKIRGVFRETMSIAKRKSFFSQNANWFGGFSHLSLEGFSVIELGDIVKSFLRDLNGFALKTNGRIYSNLCQQTLQKNECIEFHQDALPHLGTMIYLLQKLNTLTQGASTSMTYHNLATIFAPILFRTGSHEETLSTMKTTVQITEVLISRAQTISIARSRSSSVPVRNKAVDGCIGLFRHRRGYSKDRQQPPVIERDHSSTTRVDHPKTPTTAERASRPAVRLRTPGTSSAKGSPALSPRGLPAKALANALPRYLSMSTPKSTTVSRKLAPTLSFSTPKSTSVLYDNQLSISSPLTETFTETIATEEQSHVEVEMVVPTSVDLKPKEDPEAVEDNAGVEMKLKHHLDELIASLTFEDKPAEVKPEKVFEALEPPSTSMIIQAPEPKRTETLATFKTPSFSDFTGYKNAEKIKTEDAKTNDAKDSIRQSASSSYIAPRPKSTESFRTFKTPSFSDFTGFKNAEKTKADQEKRNDIKETADQSTSTSFIEPKQSEGFGTFKTPSSSDFAVFKKTDKAQEEFRSGDPFTDENQAILNRMAHYGRPSLVFAQGRGIVTAALQRLNTDQITDGRVTYSRSQKTNTATVKKNTTLDGKKAYNPTMFKRPGN